MSNLESITKHKMSIAIEVLEWEKTEILKRIAFIEQSIEFFKKELFAQIKREKATRRLKP